MTRNQPSSFTVHQRIMSVGLEPLVKEGSWMRAHIIQAFTFILKQRQGQRRAMQQNQENNIQVDQQSGTNGASPATNPIGCCCGGEDKQEDRYNLGDGLLLEGGEDSRTTSWCDLTVTSGHDGSLGGIQARN